MSTALQRAAFRRLPDAQAYVSSVAERSCLGNSESPRRHVIVADDNDQCRQWLEEPLVKWGYDPVFVVSYERLLQALEYWPDAVLVLDSGFGISGGLAAFRSLLQEGWNPSVVFVAENEQSEAAITAVKMGARDFVEKTSSLNSVQSVLVDAVEPVAARVCTGTSALIGNSVVMRELRATIRHVASTDAAVIIIGESGTGKELVARAIHDCSQRSEEEFVPVNMAALPESLVESVLFGHEKGAFTGAETRQVGLCQQADGGTLFLDEISEMHRDLQPKLLRFLQEYTYQRVGSTKTERADVRIVSATNRNPYDMVKSGEFREDLFFRLNVIPIALPPLRDRKEDIPLLVRTFAAQACRRNGRKVTFSDSLMRKLQQFDWPGNVRQLQNLVERMVIMARTDVLNESHLPGDFCLNTVTLLKPDATERAISSRPADDRVVPNSQGETRHSEPVPLVRSRAGLASLDLAPVRVGDRFLTRMELIERASIIHALEEHGGNVTAAARYLGLGPATIYRKIRALQIGGTAVGESRSSLQSSAVGGV